MERVAKASFTRVGPVARHVEKQDESVRAVEDVVLESGLDVVLLLLSRLEQALGLLCGRVCVLFESIRRRTE